jgi:predicted aspartyl protease
MRKLGMGFTYVEVTVINAATASKQDVELLVDTRALLTAIPRKILVSLGITPIGKRTLRLFGGQIVEREVGAVIIKYKEAMAGVTVIFAEEKDTPVLGATALEALGYQVDPTTKQLKPVELLMV